MPSLHELFDAATDGMPPLPDLAPSARRIVRRRQLATRTSAAVLSSALVIGAGTFALSVQHSGNARDAASGPPHAYNQQYVLDTLRNLWPNKNQQLSAMPGGIGIVVTQAGKEAAFAYFSVFADASKFPSELSCLSQQDCLKATTDDGDNVLAEHGQFSPAAATASASHTLSQTLPPTTPATTPTIRFEFAVEADRPGLRSKPRIPAARRVLRSALHCRPDRRAADDGSATPRNYGIPRVRATNRERRRRLIGQLLRHAATRRPQRHRKRRPIPVDLRHI